ncbi:MAG: flagellar biosynthesis protein FlhB [Granulosicoccus sp.]|nr:flagellar biosynthesis protein FlhB [Granulosicoccus sp.]
MAEQDTGQERTYDASPKRLSDARAKGDVPRSKELNTVLMLLASMLGLALLGGTGVRAYRQLTATQWNVQRSDIFSDQAIVISFMEFLLQALWISAPFLLLMFVAVFIGPLCMGGWVFATSSLKFNISKVNPLTGLKRMVGIQSLAELLKALMKVVLLGGVSVILLGVYRDDFLALALLPVDAAIDRMFALMFVVFVLLILTLGLVALVDVPFQRWSYAKKLRMTLQEIRQENKEQQGNPEVKAKARQLQQGYASSRALVDVPTADVIIVNPTHYSVALKYNEDQVAPTVVAKGLDLMALRIREIASEHDVPVFSAPPLARALYRHTEIGETIPSELYLAVAQVLAYVLQVKEASFTEQRRMVPPSDLPVPDSFKDQKDN